MKEKRILAMFIASAVTLVASLSITFGVLTTLADPVVATGITRYAYNFGGTNNSLVVEEGTIIKMNEDIIFKPSSALEWQEPSSDPTTGSDKKTVWFNGLNYESDIWFNDESVSSKLKVIPLRITNSYSSFTNFKLTVTFDDTTPLGEYTCVKLYDYLDDEQGFETLDGAKYFDLKAGEYIDFAIIVYVDDTDNLGLSQINYDQENGDWEKINIEVENITRVG